MEAVLCGGRAVCDAEHHGGRVGPDQRCESAGSWSAMDHGDMIFNSAASKGGFVLSEKHTFSAHCHAGRALMMPQGGLLIVRPQDVLR